MAVLLYLGESRTNPSLELAERYRGEPAEAPTKVRVTITNVYVDDMIDLAFTDEFLSCSVGVDHEDGPSRIVPLKGRTRFYQDVTAAEADPDEPGELAKEVAVSAPCFKVKPRIVQIRDRESLMERLDEIVEDVQDLRKKLEELGFGDQVDEWLDAIEKEGMTLVEVVKKGFFKTLEQIGLGGWEGLVIQLLIRGGRFIIDVIFRDAVELESTFTFDLAGTSTKYARYRPGYYLAAYYEETTFVESDDLKAHTALWRAENGRLIGPKRRHRPNFLTFRIEPA